MKATLARYLMRRVGGDIVLMLIAIVALMQVLELLDVTTEILGRQQGVLGLVTYALLRLPSEFVLALPLAVLFGAMKAFSAMASAQEITAMRCVGFNLMRMLRRLLPMLALIALVQFAVSEGVVARAQVGLKEWWSATAVVAKDKPRIWARTSGGLVSIASTTPDGSVLKAVRIYGRDPEGQLAERVYASEARWSGAGWRLADVTVLDITAGAAKRVHEAEREWVSNLRPDDVLRLDESRPLLSSTMLSEVISGDRAGSQPRSYYETMLYRSFTGPLSVFVMLVLAMPTACSSFRSGGGGLQMLVALGLGLTFLLVDGMLSALGTSGALPPLPVALLAPALFTAIGLWRIRAYELP